MRPSLEKMLPAAAASMGSSTRCFVATSHMEHSSTGLGCLLTLVPNSSEHKHGGGLATPVTQTPMKPLHLHWAFLDLAFFNNYINIMDGISISVVASITITGCGLELLCNGVGLYSHWLCMTPIVVIIFCTGFLRRQ